MPDYRFTQAVLYNVVPLGRDVSYVPYVKGRSRPRPKHTFILNVWADVGVVHLPAAVEL